jgi:hypothetical protein
MAMICPRSWLHHLKSEKKRKLIVAWARELGLAGASKPGFPGEPRLQGRQRLCA